MFIFTQFMDQITKFAAELVGGAELRSNWNVSATDMAKKSFGAIRAIQSRAINAARKHGGKVARKGVESGKSVIRAAGDEGKSMAKPSDGGGNTNAMAEKKGGSDNVSSTPAPKKDGGDSAQQASSSDAPKKDGDDNVTAAQPKAGDGAGVDSATTTAVGATHPKS